MSTNFNINYAENSYCDYMTYDNFSSFIDRIDPKLVWDVLILRQQIQILGSQNTLIVIYNICMITHSDPPPTGKMKKKDFF